MLHRKPAPPALLRRRQDRTRAPGRGARRLRARGSDLLLGQHHRPAAARTREDADRREPGRALEAYRAAAPLAHRALVTAAQPRTRIAQVSLATLLSTFGTRFKRLIEGG